ncbi:hypothetical protein ABT392_16840 [Paucibacter sp. JuS9]|uniref:rolling circle replication-associated protein n=1 Tax=Paucibacter sp. JuS9 TaxID=3228748 RepID=UPI0037579F18
MSLHAAINWHAEHGEPFDALARERLGIRARPEYSSRAHLQDKFEHGYTTPVRSRQHRAEQFAVSRAAERGEAAGLVSVPTSWKTDLAEAVDSLDLVLCTDEAKAKRRLAKLRCAVGFSARAHAVSEKGHRTDQAWMVTLTYRPGVDWSPKHVSGALLKARDWCRSKGYAFRYVWIAEIQDGKRRADGVGRDVIHYHAVVWLPVGVRCPHFDKRGWWPHGMSQSLKAKNSIGYLLHYLKKDKELAAMPKGARAYGVGGLDKTARRSRRWLGLPSFVQANSDVHDDWKRAAGGGWASPDGVLYPSEFERVKVGGIDALRRVHRHSRAIEAGGPFSWLSRSPVH